MLAGGQQRLTWKSRADLMDESLSIDSSVTEPHGLGRKTLFRLVLSCWLEQYSADLRDMHDNGRILKRRGETLSMVCSVDASLL